MPCGSYLLGLATGDRASATGDQGRNSKRAAPRTERLFSPGLETGYFLASARFFSWNALTISSCEFLGTGSYLANSIENSPLPWVAERSEVE